MKCDIIWCNQEPQRWNTAFSAIPQSNLLQSRAYGDAMLAAYGQKSRRGIIHINDQDAGIVQILETGLFWNAIHALILDRGPLWFDGFGGAAHVQAFFREIQALYPRRFGRKRRILPEIEDGPAIQKVLEQIGLNRQNRPGYQTLWLDIRKETNVLKESLRKNWRGALNKAERSGIEVQWDQNGDLLPWMLDVYEKDKKERSYNGAAPQILHKIARFALQTGDCLIGQARKDRLPVAGMMVLCHGQAATYQVGWSSAPGRSVSANHLLLWQAINVLKDHGIHFFDLGGVNDETAKGIKEFKQGLGGTLVQLVGHYT